MEPLVDTIIEDDRWEVFGLAPLAEAAGRAALTELGLEPDGFEISLMGCDDARIAVLNADFRGKPQPTNVLSWPAEERGADIPGAAPDLPEPGPPALRAELGDIAIAYDTCEREAQAAAKPMADHVTHLVIHGTLHLLGYDHVREADGDLMEAVEVRILARLGLSDPYEGGGH